MVGPFNARMQTIRQMAQNVSLLVELAAVNDTQGTEDLPDSRPQGFGPIDDEQTSSLMVQAPVNEIPEQGLGHAAVLRGAFPKAQNLLLSLPIDAQSDQHRMIAHALRHLAPGTTEVRTTCVFGSSQSPPHPAPRLRWVSKDTHLSETAMTSWVCPAQHPSGPGLSRGRGWCASAEPSSSGNRPRRSRPRRTPRRPPRTPAWGCAQRPRPRISSRVSYR